MIKSLVGLHTIWLQYSLGQANVLPWAMESSPSCASSICTQISSTAAISGHLSGLDGHSSAFPFTWSRQNCGTHAWTSIKVLTRVFWIQFAIVRFPHNDTKPWLSWGLSCTCVTSRWSQCLCLFPLGWKAKGFRSAPISDRFGYLDAPSRLDLHGS